MGKAVYVKKSFTKKKLMNFSNVIYHKGLSYMHTFHDSRFLQQDKILKKKIQLILI